MVQRTKKTSDQVSACSQREDREWKYQKKSVAGGLVCKLFSQVDRSDQAEVVVAQGSEFVPYS